MKIAKRLLTALSLLLVLGLLVQCGDAADLLGSVEERVAEAGFVETFTVSYDGNGHDGGDVPVDNTTYPVGQSVTVKGSGTMVLAGNTFVGWNTEQNGVGTRYGEGDTFAMPKQDVTLFAQWTTSPTFSVTYHPNGADAGDAPIDANRYETGHTVTVKDQGTLAQTGYRFTGWNTEELGGGAPHDVGTTFQMGDQDIDLHAQWELAGYTVTFLAQGGSAPEPGFIEVTYSAQYGTLATTTRTGYTFDGWFTTAGDEVFSSTVVSTPASHSLYARWTPVVYGILYHLNGGTNHPDNPFSYTTEDTVTLRAPTRTGYDFGGWYRSSVFTGSAVSVLSAGSIGDEELWAKWADTTPPNAPTVGVSGTTASPTQDRTPTWTWSSGGGGGAGYYLYRLNNSVRPSSGETSATAYSSSTLSEGVHTLYVWERDSSGNWSTHGSHSIEVDVLPAMTSVQVQDLTSGSSSGTDDVDVRIATVGSNVDQMRIRNYVGGSWGTWTSWLTYTTSRHWRLTSGGGTKQVQIEYRDGQGNTAGPYRRDISYSPSYANIDKDEIADATMNASKIEIKGAYGGYPTGGVNVGDVILFKPTSSGNYGKMRVKSILSYGMAVEYEVYAPSGAVARSSSSWSLVTTIDNMYYDAENGTSFDYLYSYHDLKVEDVSSGGYSGLELKPVNATGLSYYVQQ